MDKQIQTIDELHQTLQEIEMTNTALDFNWKFESKLCNDPDMYGWFVRVAFDRPDTETGKVGTGYGRYEFVAMNTTESGIVKTCWLLIELVVRHELMEAFRWKNKRIFNPHNSIHDLAKIQG